MADMVKCPLCETLNPPANKICQKCQTPLSGQAFQPGQSPVRKDTGELEPILPEWLRDARESAKQSSLEQPPAPTPAPTQPASRVDFLAGLQSQSEAEAEEEVPDWLASITGKQSPQPKAEATDEEFGGARWVETGRKNDFEPSDETPDWLAGLQAPAPGAGEKDELTDWFRESEGGKSMFTQEPAPSSVAPMPPPTPEETPDWLKQMATDAGEKTDAPASESSDWFNQTQPEASAGDSSDTPDWLKQMAADAGENAVGPAFESSDRFHQTQPEANAGDSGDTPDWLKHMAADADIPAQSSVESASIPSDAPDWLKDLGTATGGAEAAPFADPAPDKSEPFAFDAGTPSWLSATESEKSDSTPDWLKEQGGEETPAWLSPEGEAQVPASSDVFNALPDWLKSAAPETSIFDEPAAASEPPPATLSSPAPAVSTFESAPAFLADDLPEAGADSLFTEMPDWLSNAVEPSSAPPVVPESLTKSDALAPDALPSWVEAMRPMEQESAVVIPSSSDQTLEARGPLAGLQGVLPAGTGFAPTSKPKGYSIKLNVSGEQLKHAEIFERILAAETAPEALISEKPFAASRGLRWTIAALLLMIAFGVAILRTKFFAIPGAPNETKYAMAVAQAIPEGAPVLVAVDYEPSRAGELETAAAPLFDNLLLLKHPRLTFISTNPSGALLVERFMNETLSFHAQNGAVYLNLGYLPGGQAGIRAFAQNPSLTAPADIFAQPAWSQPALQDVTALNHFALIVLMTDDAEAARAWVEQTQEARRMIPIVAVSSAQSAPMIQPYYESGQVEGMISGLYGGAIVEQQFNSGRPGAARNYWDAYSLGMLLSMLFTLGGGLVNLALGMRDRSAAREAK